MNIFQKVLGLISGARKSPTEISGSGHMELVHLPFAYEPNPFGYKSWWYAVQTERTEELEEFIRNIGDDLLKSYLFRVPGWQVEITAPHKGWTFFNCGLSVDAPDSIPVVKNVLVDLSRQFGEAQFFGTHRVVDYHCWAKAVHGKLLRFYCYVGESMETYGIEGEPTPVETKYHFFDPSSQEAKDDTYHERDDLYFPDESTVMEIAGDWSYDPTQFSKEDWEKIWKGAHIIKRVR